MQMSEKYWRLTGDWKGLEVTASQPSYRDVCFPCSAVVLRVG